MKKETEEKRAAMLQLKNNIDDRINDIEKQMKVQDV